MATHDPGSKDSNPYSKAQWTLIPHRRTWGTKAQGLPDSPVASLLRLQYGSLPKWSGLHEQNYGTYRYEGPGCLQSVAAECSCESYPLGLVEHTRPNQSPLVDRIPLNCNVNQSGDESSLWALRQTVGTTRQREQVVLPNVLERGTNTLSGCAIVNIQETTQRASTVRVAQQPIYSPHATIGLR